MASVPTPQVLLALATHLALKTNEPKSAWPVLGILLFAPLLPIVALNDGSSAIWNYVTFWVTLATSITLYRLSPFHPLAQHPGPLLCKITKFRVAYEAARGTTHTYHQALHAQYGTIVRVGPNELSVSDKDAISSVLGSQGMHRGPIWDGRRFELIPGQGYDTVIDVRDRNLHASLRKPWNQAFTGSAVKDYQQILARTGEELSSSLQKIAEGGEAPVVDLAKWVSYFSFDFMGRMAFGGTFNLMKEGDTQGVWKMMENGLAGPAVTGHVPWIMSLLKHLPMVVTEQEKFKDFGKHHAKKRVEMDTTEKDLFHHMYEATATDVPIGEKMDVVLSDSLLTIVAGSDTTSTVLSAALCSLLTQPATFKKLREELDDAFNAIDPTTGYPEIEMEKLLKLPYLSAVVNEGLRLAPAVPTNIQRAPEDGSGGRLLSEINLFIPEGTAVNIPCYAIHRSPTYFSPSPESFIPERWLDSSGGGQYVTTKDAFIPFSHGPANCAGKPLALVELRFVIALLVQRFDMWPKGYERDTKRKVLESVEKEWMDGLKDFFVFSKRPLEAHIIARKFGSKD